jgi:toxin CptA
MHGAPSVSYPVGRSRSADRLLSIIWTCGACCVAAACYRFDGADWRVGLLALSVIGAGAAAWRSALRRTASAELSFDGRHGSLAGAAGVRAAGIKVALDFQSSLLVCLTDARRAQRWVWLDRSTLPERWQDLRCAVYSRAPLASPVADSRQPSASGSHHPLS